MGWSTDLFCNISFNRATFDNKAQVEDDIEECDTMIKFYQNEIRDLAIITEPNKLFNLEDDESCYTHITNTIKTDLEELEYYIVQKYKLSLLLNNWDKCHQNGLAIPLPSNIDYTDAFLEGDFIKSKNNKE